MALRWVVLLPVRRTIEIGTLWLASALLTGACGPTPPHTTDPGGEPEAIRWIGHGYITGVTAIAAPERGLFVALSANGPYDFGSGNFGETSFGRGNLLFARLDAEGAPLWVTAVDHDFDDPPAVALALTAEGDLIVTVERFTLDEAVNFGATPLLGQLPSLDFGSSEDDVPIGAAARLDGADGSFVWATSLVRYNHLAYRPRDVEVPVAGPILLTGFKQDDRQPETTHGVIIAVNLSDGRFAWEVEAWPDPVLFGSRMIAVGDDEVLVSALPRGFEGGLGAISSFVPSTQTLTWTDPSPREVFGGLEMASGPLGQIALGTRLSLGGGADSRIVSLEMLAAQTRTHLWSWIVGGGDGQNARDPFVAIDSAGNVITVGTFSGSVLVGERVLQSELDAIFVLKVDGNGETIWSRYASLERDNPEDNAGLIATALFVDDRDAISIVARSDEITDSPEKLLWMRLAP